tara:strand:- start:1119 stop:1400 length:282 start_codon:yes stop_codon:yes gene_type:complete
MAKKNKYLDQIEREQRQLIKDKIGNVKPVIQKLNVKLGRRDYELLIEAIKRNTDNYNYKESIRLLFKLGATNKAMDLVNDYEDLLKGGGFLFF